MKEKTKIQPLTSKMGITLIAIIITVIIMIILLGVTVTGAINGGLFGITKEAAKKKKYANSKRRGSTER